MGSAGVILDLLICPNCVEKYEKELMPEIEKMVRVYFQPERLNPEALKEGFFPPPWNFYEYPEKTEGWIEFQRAMRKDPEYYLQGCDSLNSDNK